MTLAKQILPIPLVGGLSEHTDAVAGNGAQVMVNCRYTKVPAISKRYGYQCIGPYNKQVGGATPPTVENLFTVNGELVRVGAGQLHSYKTIGSSSDWIYKGRIPECIVTVDGVGAATLTNSVSHINPQSASASGYICSVFASLDGSTYSIIANVVDASTGTKAIARYILASSVSGSLSNPRVVASGTWAFFSWIVQSNATIVGAWLDLSSMTWGTTSLVATNIAVTGLEGVLDVDFVSSSAPEVAVLCELASGTNRISVRGITNTITAGSFDAVSGHSVLLNTTDTALIAASLRYDASGAIWVAYSRSAAAAPVKVGTVTPGASWALGTTPFAVSTGSSFVAAAAGSIQVAIERTSATTALVAWTAGIITATATEWQEITSAGVLSYNPPRALQSSFLLTRPLVRSGRAYAFVANYNLTHSTQFLVDLSLSESLPFNANPRLVATVFPRQTQPFYLQIPRFASASNWTSIDSNTYFCASFVGGGVAASPYAVVNLRASFDSTWSRTAQQSGDLLILGGGALHVYDGTTASELGFAYEPDASQVSFVKASGGSLTSSATYGYVFLYSAVDARGNVHRSRTTTVQSVAMGSSDTKVTCTIPCLQLTNRASVQIEIYRSAANGSVYFYVGSVANVAGNASVTYVDTSGDTAISSNRTVYTTGGVLQHDMPAGGPNIVATKGSLITHGSDDQSLWISGEVLAGEAPWFNSALNIPAWEGGAIVALAMLDQTPIVFKSKSAFYLQGDPPNDTGTSASYSNPIPIQVIAGCADARSVVSSHLGIARKGVGGLFLLARNLEDSNIGRPVEDDFRTSMAGAAILPDQGMVRFLQAGTSGVDVLVWDYQHGADMGQLVWYEDTLHDVRTGASANASPAACAVWQGSFVWISSSGYLYRESTAQNYDSDGLGGSYWVTMTYETSNVKAAGVSGFQRVWRVLLAGLRASNHAMTVTITTDNAVDTYSWTDTEISAFAGLPDERFMIHQADQKCSYIKVKYQDAAPGSPTGNYAGMTLRDVTLELGIKPAGNRYTVTNRK